MPAQQDVIWIDFDPAVGVEIEKRCPAVVLSHRGYSQLTNLVVVAPITHAKDNQLQEDGYFVPIKVGNVDGFANLLQFFTYDYRRRNAEYVGLLPTPEYFRIRSMVLDILR
ncbi:type II toxin-antitoxin system PemK/MazF family toxin [Schleiferilactobacillus shenzhenensis]|uniref:Uncharacterized protein n=1 Tax=Schleiferilactobacillus shenzhenensis LY-73 TaxID=1231336 RepID=U4TS36_9LACO|nr:type II toxin-antitoxin system PemK/MazF family toxin [Schleiferilactobacillus shenzhenensis]ERL64292.1 hypothetical protein L248_1060 [Schleiferilactobacillus shenzhenensis LY-73]